MSNQIISKCLDYANAKLRLSFQLVTTRKPVAHHINSGSTFNSSLGIFLSFKEAKRVDKNRQVPVKNISKIDRPKRGS